MSKQPFQAESQRLLELMIHSIYTHKEIFLRELISNASDAMDKRYYHALQEGDSGLSREDMVIQLTLDEATRTLTVSDSGVGMTREEMEQNLGVIAHSDSLRFKQDAEENADIDVIGQFGVGFYAAFMVADHVSVVSRAMGSSEAWLWTSSGVDGYEIAPLESDELPPTGTTVTLHIKADTAEEQYGEFLRSYRIRALVKQYSDYIRYPIKMEMEHTHEVPAEEEGGEPTFETHSENTLLNTMTPLWKKRKDEITHEELDGFYQEQFTDYAPPLRAVQSAGEGSATYHALLFIPSHAPYNFYTREYEKGLQLYASGVKIMDKCGDLLPDHFSFVRGLVDSQDLSLNISREMLQHDRQLKIIAGRLEKRIASELQALLRDDRAVYEEFFAQFGLQLKYGVYADYGAHKDALQELLLFATSFSAGGETSALTTLSEYVARMPEDQPYIYTAAGDSPARIAKLPQTEAVREKGYEILYLTDDVDEFALRMLGGYGDKEFRSVAGSDLGFEPEAAAEAETAEDAQGVLDAIKEALGNRVTAVRASRRMKNYPVCLVSEGELTLEMEKVLAAMPQADAADAPKASKVLELNDAHPLFSKLRVLHDSGTGDDKSRLETYAALLYDLAAMVEGLPVEDPVAFGERMAAIM